jgi:hypothetical protein
MNVPSLSTLAERSWTHPGGLLAIFSRTTLLVGRALETHSRTASEERVMKKRMFKSSEKDVGNEAALRRFKYSLSKDPSPPTKDLWGRRGLRTPYFWYLPNAVDW